MAQLCASVKRQGKLGGRSADIDQDAEVSPASGVSAESKVLRHAGKAERQVVVIARHVARRGRLERRQNI